MARTHRRLGRKSVSLALLVYSFLPATASVGAQPEKAPVPASMEQIVAALEKTELRKQNDLQSYSSVRRYVLKNARFNQDAEMMVRMDFNARNGKHFEILSEKNTEGLSHRILKKVLEGEAETSRTDAKQYSMVTQENYNFRLLGSENHAGRKCFLLEIKPKAKSKYLLEGKICVDSKDFQLVRMEGQTASSLSFWAGRPYIVFDFQKVGDFWLVARNQAVTAARFIGTTQLTIEIQGYELQPGHQEKLALENLPRLRPLASINE